MIKIDRDIVGLIGEMVTLKKRGNNFVGLCPFHSEKTPSFFVSQSKQTYHCFGCGASGDAIEFIKETEGVSFVEAVKSLGGELDVRKVERPERKRSPMLIDLLQQHISDMHYSDEQPMHDYLASRGIVDVPLSQDVGYLERCRYADDIYLPAIFVIIRSWDGQVVSGHRTYLTDGKVFDRKLMPNIGGEWDTSMKCAARIIDGDNEALFVAEGMETLLSVYRLNNGKAGSYWSTISANGMRQLKIPSHFSDIGIYCDLDRSLTGQKAGQFLSGEYDAHLYYPGKEIPDKKKSLDFNDVLLTKKMTVCNI